MRESELRPEEAIGTLGRDGLLPSHHVLRRRDRDGRCQRPSALLVEPGAPPLLLLTTQGRGGGGPD